MYSIISHKGELATIMEHNSYVQISVTNILCRVNSVYIGKEYSKIYISASEEKNPLAAVNNDWLLSIIILLLQVFNKNN